jgi:cell division protein FtsQ
VASARAETAEAVTLRLRGGSTVVWGGPAGHELKATVLRALLRQPAKVYDLSAPEAPVVRG